MGQGPLNVNVWEKKMPSQVEPFKKPQCDYGRHKLTGGSSAPVSDRLSSESFPVWFPFKSTHMARVKHTSTLLREYGSLGFSELSGWCCFSPSTGKEMLSSARVREPKDGWLVSFDSILSEAPEALQKCSVDTDAWKTVGATKAQPGELVI